MVHRNLAAAFSLIVAASPALAQASGRDGMTGAPAAGPGAKYCLRTAADTGNLIDRVWCLTRREWVEQGVDLDREWAREGISVIE